MEVALSDDFEGDLSDWQPQHLLFGDEFDRQRAWHGQLAGVMIYCRSLSGDDISQRISLAAPLLR